MKQPRIFKDITSLTKNLSAPNYLVDELIELDTIGGLIGPSSVGKSFVAISMAAAVASGTDFADKAVQQGKVLYLAGEGLNGISRRFAGWMQHTGIQIPPASLYVSQKTVSMDALGASTVLAEVESADPDINLVIIDTLARHMVGDENSNRDMTEFISVIDKIRDEYNCAVLIVHHTGHSSERSHRARGASAFYAALDFELLLTGDKKGNGTIEGSKNKEAALYQKREFSLVSVDLNGLIQRNGEPVSTAVVDWGGFVQQGSSSKKTLENTAAYQSLKAALGSKGDPSQITLEDWRDYAYQNSNRSTTDSKRTEFNGFKNKLLKNGVVEEVDGFLKVLDAELAKLSATTKPSDQGPKLDAVN